MFDTGFDPNSFEWKKKCPKRTPDVKKKVGLSPSQWRKSG
jgi:hypothetical protein